MRQRWAHQLIPMTYSGVCAGMHKLFRELIIHKYFLNEPRDFPPSSKTICNWDPILQRDSLNLCSYYVIKMIEASCQHKSACVWLLIILSGAHYREPAAFMLP